jgi:hypothetical protein
MKKDLQIKVFQVRIMYCDGSEQIEQFDVEHYRKVMSIFVTPVITSNGLILDGTRVSSVELYKPSLYEMESCPITEKKCIRPDGDCRSCFLANELMKDVFGDNV